MKLKSLFLSLFIMVATVAIAQVEAGKVYRIVNGKYGTVISENPIENKLTCASAGSEADYQQMWQFEPQEDGRYLIKNVFSCRYIQNETGTNVVFKTGTGKDVFFRIVKNEKSSSGKDVYFNIDASNPNSKPEGWGLHCASGGKVVPWSYGPTKDDIVSGSEWQFEEVALDEATIAAAFEEYKAFLATIMVKGEIEEAAVKFFEDNACTILKEEYASMSDDALMEALGEVIPMDLKMAIVKIKNDGWDTVTREKDFRVYSYKPYSNPEVWADRLFLRPFNRINNPTGICTESDKGFIYVFVDEIPEGTTMSLSQMPYTKYHYNDGSETDLHVGLNVIPTSFKNGTVFLRYIAETAVGGKKLADYPRVKVHIENGYVNGFWSKERGHTNEDWKYMQEHMFKNPESLIAVGDLTMMNFRKAEFLEPYKGYDDYGYKIEGCHSNIEEIMTMWDFWNTSQQKNMALDKYWDYFNNKQLAMSDDGGFMDAGAYRTHYNNNTLNTIVNYDRITRDAGSAWGPNHEIGHTNQYAFQIVGTSEVSNNALANFATFEVGTHTSRGNNLENQILDFEANVPYVVRGEKEFGWRLFSMTRMYFQLYLYFHAAEKDTTFYPRLFEELRKDRLVGWVTSAKDELDEKGYYIGSMDAKYDQLKFVEKCCEVAQMDLTEFFEAWGFFIPMKNAYVGDYGHHYVYLHQSSIDSCLAGIKAKNYPKKGGHLMFLEDRVRPSKKKASSINTDTVNYREDYSWEVPVGSVGDFGQWEDYIDESVKAEGYYYAVANGVVEIMEAEGAKGALGFKLYNADTNKLLTYTNKKSMKVPVSAQSAKLKVVAAQASGEDYVVPHASEGPAELQRTALEKALASAVKVVKHQSKKGYEIGCFHADSVASLVAIYNEALNAYNSGDANVSLAEISVKLNSEYSKVISNPANRVQFEEGMTAYFVPVSAGRNGGSAMAYTNVGGKLTVASGRLESDPNKAWNVEYAGNAGEYYLKNGSGYYVTNLELNNEVVAMGSKLATNAVKFNIVYSDSATISFLPVNNMAITFGAKQDKGGYVVSGMSAGDADAAWYGVVIENNSAEVYKEELENALAKANIMITEIINLDSLNSMNIFNDAIKVLDRNLETYALSLLDTYNKIVKDANKDSKHKEYLAELRQLFSLIEGKYIVTAPIKTAGTTVLWYRVYSKETGMYLSVNEDDNTLLLVRAKDVDDNALWSFAAAPRGEYRMYNAGMESFIYKDPIYSSYIFVNNEDLNPVALTFDNEESAMIFSVAGSAFVEGEPEVYLDVMRLGSYWNIELVAIESDKEIADIITVIENVLPAANLDGDIYDLNGRKVVAKTTGIYIQDGKKVYVK